MTRAKAYQKRQAKARQRRRRTAQERLERDRHQAQRAAEALHQALEELGLPDTLVTEIEGRLRSQQQLLGKIVGSWIKRLRRLGVEVLLPLWRHTAIASAATRSRWQWTWVGDDSVFKKYGEQLGLVGTWWSGQEHRVLSGIDGVLLVVVIGDGKLVVPVDFAIRRPDPTGPGAPCRDKLHWVQVMLDGRIAALRRRGVNLPPPIVVADSWFSDSKLI